MPYARYTQVPVTRTRAEIEHLLAQAKAQQYGTAIDYELARARVQFKLNNRIIRFTIGLPDRKKFGVGAKFDRAERQK